MHMYISISIKVQHTLIMACHAVQNQISMHENQFRIGNDDYGFGFFVTETDTFQF